MPMRNAPLTPLPGWLDRAAYPFQPRAFATADGRMSYVDEGGGPPVVLVHGTPTWSFVWRDLIVRLAAAGHRVIAPDHLGFGLSDKPAGAPYGPEDHARRLRALLDALEVRGATLVVHDFGGPIGLSAALERPGALDGGPGAIAGLVLLNTWGWGLTGDRRLALMGRLGASALGRLLCLRFNAEPRWLVPAVFADRRRLTPAAHRQYIAPFPDPESRAGPWALAQALLGASPWYDRLWDGLQARGAALARLPALLVWGMRDPVFGPACLARWRGLLPHARVAEVAGSGHFVQEEAPDVVAARVLELLRAGASRGPSPAP
ncbi:MAG TPA: alpha/beta fold hydrolase [Longimicrobium sp.]|nr:alpha/beta fold hydrolase [Longimicrobium sp.]